MLIYKDAKLIEKEKMISNIARVYKGCSWKDRSMYINAAQRRPLEEDKARNDIGFRCVMSIVGGSEFKRY